MGKFVNKRAAALALGMAAVSNVALAAAYTDADKEAFQRELDAASGMVSGGRVPTQPEVVSGAAVDSSMAKDTAVSQAGADGFTDVPKGHWAYDAIDYLAKEGIIEGMGDGTFQGGRTMTRYEMAVITAKAAQSDSLSYGDKLTVDKLREEFGSDIETLKSQVASNTKEINRLKELADKIHLSGFFRVSYDHDNNQMNYSPDRNENRRFYADFHMDYKASDIWTVSFQAETNRHYARGTRKGIAYNRDKMLRDGEADGDTGTFQRIWTEGRFKNGVHVDIGRRWRSLGFQNLFLGAETDGVVVDFPINKSGLRGDVFYQSLSDHSWDNLNFDFYGIGISGPIGHNFDINVQLAKSTKSKTQGLTDGGTGNVNEFGDFGWVASFAFNPARNLRFIFDYGRTNHDKTDGFKNYFYAARLNYRWADRQKPGSWDAYLRWIDLGQYGDFGGDAEWDSLLAGSRGWIVGMHYVPWKNTQLNLMYERASIEQSVGATAAKYGNDKRNLFRAEFDVFF